MVALFPTLISWLSYPKNRNTKTAFPSATLMEYCPFASAVAPLVVPFTRTFPPIKASFVTASTIFPLIVLPDPCPKVKSGTKPNNMSNMEIPLMLIKLDCNVPF